MECIRLNRRCLQSLLYAVFVGSPGIALSADNGFYIGASRSDVSSDYDVSASPFAGEAEDDGSAFKLIAGLRPLDKLAIEANSADLGATPVPLSLACVPTPCPTEISFDARALSVSVVGLYDLPLVDLFARAGVARWELEQTLIETTEEEGSDLTYGAGAQLRVGSFALRLEYERFELEDDSVDLVSFGFTYTFL